MSRYLHAYETFDLDSCLRLAPEGHCQWCGKPLTGRCKVFCKAVKVELYTGRFDDRRVCADAFFAFWLTIPRFKRVVFIRDNFTCQMPGCGLHPTIANEHGLVIPAIGLLAIDHIYPYSKGGKTDPSNLQVLCRKCNAKKRDKTDFAPQLVLISEGSQI